MPNVLAPIPVLAAIVNPKEGTITNFFRLRWQSLIDGFQQSNNVANTPVTAQTAAITTTNAYVTLAAGLYRVSYYMRKTAADGVSSSLAFTLGWTDNGVPVTYTNPALTLDSVVAVQSGSSVVYADANAAITFAVAYASNTPGKMTYNLYIVIESLP